MLCTFVELDHGLGRVSRVFMVQSPAVAKAGIVGVAGSVLSIFNVLFSLIQLVVPPEEIYEFCQH